MVVTEAMVHFGECVKRVEAQLSDVNNPTKSGSGDIDCTLEARVVGHDAVVVKHHAGNTHQWLHLTLMPTSFQAMSQRTERFEGFGWDRIAA